VLTIAADGLVVTIDRYAARVVHDRCDKRITLTGGPGVPTGEMVKLARAVGRLHRCGPRSSRWDLS
jgi:hypothetical protein